MDPGPSSRLLRSIIAASLLVSLYPASFAGAQPSISCIGTDGVVNVVEQVSYTDSDGRRWLDGTVVNDSPVVLRSAMVPVTLWYGPLDSETKDVGVAARTLAPGQRSTFHLAVPDGAEESTPVASAGGGWATDAEALSLEVVSVTRRPEPLAGLSAAYLAETSLRTYDVVIRNTAGVPVGDVSVWGTEREAAAEESGTLLSALEGELCGKVLAPGASATVVLKACAPEDADPLTAVKTEVFAQAAEQPSIALSFGDRSPAFGERVPFTISLKDSAGQPLSGERTVKLYWSTDGCNWRYTYFTAKAGIAKGSVEPQNKTFYKAVFWGDHQYAQAHSAKQFIYPATQVTTPEVAPTSVTKGATFSAVGYITPDHAAGSREIKVQCYRYEGGRWVLRKTVAATTSAYPGAKAKYRASVSLSATGRWRLRALHPADEQTQRDTSGVDYVTVR